MKSMVLWLSLLCEKKGLSITALVWLLWNVYIHSWLHLEFQICSNIVQPLWWLNLGWIERCLESWLNCEASEFIHWLTHYLTHSQFMDPQGLAPDWRKRVTGGVFFESCTFFLVLSFFLGICPWLEEELSSITQFRCNVSTFESLNYSMLKSWAKINLPSLPCVLWAFCSNNRRGPTETLKNTYFPYYPC